ncbi:MAG: hypothetical protein NZ920_00380 [Aigarchaeota archaeon]|nr:hypothetical protein [Aigarchaeota archaeon]
MARELIVVTGPPRSGKTTFITRLIERLRSLGESFAGMITVEVRESGERRGFDVMDVSTGVSAPLARKGGGSGPRVGSYLVYIDNLERVGVSAIEAHLQDKTVLFIDEVGPMEVLSSRFVDAVKRSVYSKERLIITRHYHMRHELVTLIDSRATLTVDLMRRPSISLDGVVERLIGPR